MIILEAEKSLKISFEFPLNWQLSKNRKFIGRTKKVLNPQYVNCKNEISWLCRKAINDTGCHFIKSKIWIKILVYKGIKGDCSNLIEGVLDAIKTQVQVDDNYYSVLCDFTMGKIKKVHVEVIQEQGVDGEQE